MALFILLALIAAQCVRMGMADLLVQTGQFEVDRQASASAKPGMAQVSGTLRFFTESLEYIPDNPWALERAGAMDLAKMRASRIPREARAAARDARARFRLALVQRPTSPFLWANLALSKLYLDEIDDELFSALRQTIQRGAARNSSKMFQIVKSYARFDLVCAIDKYQVIAGPDCKQADKPE